jgi:hypothetical protein
MISTSIFSLGFGLAAVVLISVAAFAMGWFFGRSRSSSKSNPATRSDTSLEVPGDPGEEEEDPTAPIAPMVEMSRSPHDRHRDLSVGKSLVRQIDFLDAMILAATKKKDEELLSQLTLLHDEFETLLKDCSVEPFSFEPDTVVSAEMRARIQIVAGTSDPEQRTRIAETVQCGYLYAHGDEDSMILRKAEVKIG